MGCPRLRRACGPVGIFREVVVSRKGAFSCLIKSGVMFAVNVDVRGNAGAPLGAYRQALLASMQARSSVAPCSNSREHTAAVETCVRSKIAIVMCRLVKYAC